MSELPKGPKGLGTWRRGRRTTQCPAGVSEVIRAGVQAWPSGPRGVAPPAGLPASDRSLARSQSVGSLLSPVTLALLRFT